MSSANLELVRSIYAAWERGDFLWVDWADPDIHYANAGGFLPGEWSGIGGMTEGFREFISAFDDWGVVADDFLDLSGERVLVSFHQTGRGKASGIDVEQLHSDGATLFECSEGRVTKISQYSDRDDALADLGLTPNTGT